MPGRLVLSSPAPGFVVRTRAKTPRRPTPRPRSAAPARRPRQRGAVNASAPSPGTVPRGFGLPHHRLPYAAAVTGTSPRLPSAITAGPRRGRRRRLPSTFHQARRAAQSRQLKLHATQAGPASSIRPRQAVSTAEAAASAGSPPARHRPEGPPDRGRAEADLAAALLHERRQPIGKRCAANSPDVRLDAEPRRTGNLAAGIVIRSPVRGLTPEAGRARDVELAEAGESVPRCEERW